MIAFNESGEGREGFDEIECIKMLSNDKFCCSYVPVCFNIIINIVCKLTNAQIS